MNGPGIIKCHRYSRIFLIIVLFNKLPFCQVMAENSEVLIFLFIVFLIWGLPK